MIVHVAVSRSFEPLDLDLEVFAEARDAETWCEEAAEQGVEDENLFLFSCEVRAATH